MCLFEFLKLDKRGVACFLCFFDFLPKTRKTPDPRWGQADPETHFWNELKPEIAKNEGSEQVGMRFPSNQHVFWWFSYLAWPLYILFDFSIIACKMLFHVWLPAYNCEGILTYVLLLPIMLENDLQKGIYTLLTMLPLSMQVGWDESTAGERQPRVSLWEIEPLTTFPMYPSPFPLRLKRPWPPGLPPLHGIYADCFLLFYENS